MHQGFWHPIGQNENMLGSFHIDIDSVLCSLGCVIINTAEPGLLWWWPIKIMIDRLVGWLINWLIGWLIGNGLILADMPWAC